MKTVEKIKWLAHIAREAIINFRDLCMEGEILSHLHHARDVQSFPSELFFTAILEL